MSGAFLSCNGMFGIIGVFYTFVLIVSGVMVTREYSHHRQIYFSRMDLTLPKNPYVPTDLVYEIIQAPCYRTLQNTNNQVLKYVF